MKEAFEVFCNKGVAGSTSAELLATFCDNLLKKGGSERLSDEAIEDTLEKVRGVRTFWYRMGLVNVCIGSLTKIGVKELDRLLVGFGIIGRRFGFCGKETSAHST